MKDPLGRVIEPKGVYIEEEVIFNDNFYGVVLTDMGLKRFTDIPEESEKLQETLKRIGALAMTKSSPSKKVIRVEVLLAALRIHGYEYAGADLKDKIKGIDFRTLSPQSIRTMNRFTRLAL